MDHDHLLANIQPRRLKCMNVTIDGRRTSLRMEMDIWDALHEIGEREQLTVNELCIFVSDNIGDWRKQREADSSPEPTAAEGAEPFGEAEVEQKVKGGGTVTLTAAIRVFIMNYFRRLAHGVAPAHEGQNHLTSSAQGAGGVAA